MYLSARSNQGNTVTSMEYGPIFHVMPIGKYYCKNMKYRINIYILYVVQIPWNILVGWWEGMGLFIRWN